MLTRDKKMGLRVGFLAVVFVLANSADAASAELDRAFLVNPHDIDGMAAAFDQAITMPKNEKARRMRSLRQRIRRRTVYNWADDFLGAVEAANPLSAGEPR